MKIKIITKLFSTFLIILSLSVSKSFGQKIEIGQEAKQVERIVEMTTRDRIGFDRYGRSKGNNAGWDVKYYNGEISEVIQCFYKQYLADIRLFANYCKHYVMRDSKLAYVLTQYEDVSVSKLKEFYSQSPRNKKIEEFYFSDDYTHYSKIYLHSNGLATVEQQKTNPQNLPASIQAKIKNELTKTKEIERQRYLADYKESQNKKAIKSKVYDLKEYSPENYKRAVESLRWSLKKYFIDTSKYNSVENFPSFLTINNSKEKYARFSNVYSAHYSNKDHSRETVNYGNVVMAGSTDIRLIKDVKLISGTDEELKLFKSASIYLPTIEVEGYEVMTEVYLNPLKVDFARGITRVKIKNGKVEFRKFIPEQDLQQIITEQLEDKRNGTYLVRYEISEIFGEVDVNIEIQ